MIETIKKEKLALISAIYFLVLTVWWIILQFNFADFKKFQLDLFTVTYGYIAAWGGLWGITVARKWGWVNSLLGKAVLMFSLGLLFQELGQLIYTYFIYIKNIEVPYPSLGDVGFFGSIVFYTLGAYYLYRISNVKMVLKDLKSKILFTIIPLIMIGIPYFLFINGQTFQWSNSVKTVLDLGYPLVEAFYISIALITFSLSGKILGGVMKPVIVSFLIALMVQYLADFSFLYQSSRGTWQVSGVSDYIYFSAYFLMTISIFQLNTVLNKLRS